MEPVERLSGLDVFSDLNELDLNEIARVISFRNFRKNEQILSYGCSDKDVYFISEGSVRATIFFPIGSGNFISRSGVRNDVR